MMVCPFYLVRLKYVFTSIRNLDITVYKKLMHVDRSASNPTTHVLVSSPYQLARSIPAHIQDRSASNPTAHVLVSSHYELVRSLPAHIQNNLLNEVASFSLIPRPLLSQLLR